MSKRGFRDLIVWQKGKSPAVSIYRLTQGPAFNRDFSLSDQMRRAAVSVCSNIAEGDERDTDKDSVRFFYMAKGSLAELASQLEIACEIGYLSEEEHSHLQVLGSEIGRMLGALIKARSKNSAGRQEVKTEKKN
jgi:four helix bundle protein